MTIGAAVRHVRYVVQAFDSTTPSSSATRCVTAAATVVVVAVVVSSFREQPGCLADE